MSKLTFLAKTLIRASANANQQHVNYYDDDIDVNNILKELGIDPGTFEYKLTLKSYSMEQFIDGAVPSSTIESILEEMKSENDYGSYSSYDSYKNETDISSMIKQLGFDEDVFIKVLNYNGYCLNDFEEDRIPDKNIEKILEESKQEQLKKENGTYEEQPESTYLPPDEEEEIIDLLNEYIHLANHEDIFEYTLEGHLKNADKFLLNDTIIIREFNFEYFEEDLKDYGYNVDDLTYWGDITREHQNLCSDSNIIKCQKSFEEYCYNNLTDDELSLLFDTFLDIEFDNTKNKKKQIKYLINSAAVPVAFPTIEFKYTGFQLDESKAFYIFSAWNNNIYYLKRAIEVIKDLDIESLTDILIFFKKLELSLDGNDLVNMYQEFLNKKISPNRVNFIHLLYYLSTYVSKDIMQEYATNKNIKLNDLDIDDIEDIEKVSLTTYLFFTLSRFEIESLYKKFSNRVKLSDVPIESKFGYDESSACFENKYAQVKYLVDNIPNNKLGTAVGIKIPKKQKKKRKKNPQSKTDNNKPKNVTLQNEDIKTPINQENNAQQDIQSENDNSTLPSDEINFCPECGFKITNNANFCSNCGTSLVEFDNSLNDDSQNISEALPTSIEHIQKEGLSLDYPGYYLVANIPSNAPDCVVALAKNDGKCDVMIEVSPASKIPYQEGTFERKYKNYIKDLGFYDMTVIQGFGPNETCVQAYSTNGTDIIKSVIYFNFKFKKDIRITLNSLKKDNYNCMNDLKVISSNISYKKKFLGIF